MLLLLFLVGGEGSSARRMGEAVGVAEAETVGDVSIRGGWAMLLVVVVGAWLSGGYREARAWSEGCERRLCVHGGGEGGWGVNVWGWGALQHASLIEHEYLQLAPAGNEKGLSLLWLLVGRLVARALGVTTSWQMSWSCARRVSVRLRPRTVGMICPPRRLRLLLPCVRSRGDWMGQRLANVRPFGVCFPHHTFFTLDELWVHQNMPIDAANQRVERGGSYRAIEASENHPQSQGQKARVQP